jgi:hypothetical protein
MAYTFLDYQTEGASYVLAPSDPEALAIAGSGLNSAVNKLNGFNWSCMIASSGITFVAGQTDYTIPSGVRSPRALRIPSDSRIGFVPREVFNAELPEYQATGDPKKYTYINTFGAQKIRLSNAPSQAWVTAHPTATFEYYARIPNLSGNSETLSVPPEFEEVCMNYVRQFCAMRNDGDNLIRYKEAKQEFDEGFARIYSNEMNDQMTDME